MIALESKDCQIGEKLLHTRNSPQFSLTLRLNTISAYDMLLSILSGTQQISELTIRQVIMPARPGAFHQLFEE